MQKFRLNPGVQSGILTKHRIESMTVFFDMIIKASDERKPLLAREYFAELSPRNQTVFRRTVEFADLSDETKGKINKALFFK